MPKDEKGNHSMNKVFVVQELKRYHCPKCEGTYSKKLFIDNQFAGFKCQQCKHEYETGVLKPIQSLTEAAAYGELEVLFHGKDVGIALSPIVAQFKNLLRHYDDTDYILPVGDPVLIGIACAIAAKENRGQIKLLRWDRQTRNYIKVEAKV